MSKGIFITGTDTGIGKTVISCGLLRELNKPGLRTAAMKPVASGADIIEGQWVNDDALKLQQAASEDIAYDLINPYCFEPAIAPHLAAQQANIHIDFEKIKQCYTTIARKSDVVIVEGVGGWLVPLNTHETVADLAKYLELPVILVVGIRLGCLSHALLTVESIQQKQVNMVGWVANIIEPDVAFVNDNIESLKQKINAPLKTIVAPDAASN